MRACKRWQTSPRHSATRWSRASEARKPYVERALERREALFRTLDAKGEGKITKEAYLVMARPHFAEIDVNQAGKITVADLRRAHHGP